jgi:signal transduction histidine kinase/DNA-binding response OmpR family regulator/ligand-binding sensor domain-containing protein
VDRHRRLLLAVAIAISSGFVTAPAASQAPLVPSFGVSRWTTDDGLPSHFIPDVVRTSDGFLWMAAGGVLVRFDGVEFREVGTDASRAGLGYIRGLEAGVGDTIWLMGATERVVPYADGRFLPGDSVGVANSVVQGGQGDLWVTSTTHVWRRDPDGFRLVLDISLPGPLLPQGVNLAVNADGEVWRMGQGPVAWRLVSDGPRLPAAVGTLVEDPSHGRVLIATGEADRLAVGEPGGPTLYSLPAKDRIPRKVDSFGRLWVTVPGGLEVHLPEGGGSHAIDFGEPDIYVHQVIEAPGGSFWAGSDQHGLFRVQEQPFRTFPTQPDSPGRQALSIGPWTDGAVVAADLAGAATMLDGTRIEQVRPPASGTVAALVDSRGTRWFSEYRGGTSNGVVGTTAQGAAIRLPMPPRPLKVLEDPYEPGVLWLINPYLARYQPYGGQRVDTIFSADEPVRDIAWVGPDDFWVAGGDGVAHIGPQGRRDYRSEDGYPVRIGRAVYVDPATGDVWIGTYQDGLVRFRDGEFGVVRAEDGLYEDVVSEILPDDAGNLWMAGNRSVHRIGLDEANAFLEGSIDRVRGVGYGRESGLSNAETSGYAGHRDANGRLWFPTFDGAAVVDPAEALRMDAVPPRLSIDAVSLGGEPFLPGSGETLAPHRRRLDVRYGAIYLRDPARVAYEVWLEGADAGWRDVGSTTELSYSSLSPGDYVLHLRARGPYGASSEENAEVAFTVTPYFRETLWMPLTGLLALGALVALAWRARVRGLEHQRLRLTRLVEERTRDLTEEQRRTREQAERIGELNRARSRFFANLSHELRTPLTLILGPLQDLLDAAQDDMRDLDRNALSAALQSGWRLNRLVDQLLDMARSESGRVKLRLRTVDGVALLARLAESFEPLALARSTTLALELPDEVAPVTVDTDQADTVFSNLLDNAFKYTPLGATVTLGAEIRRLDDGDCLVVSVEDDGPGIPPDDLPRIFERFHRAAPGAVPGAGLGLSLTKDLVELLGGRIDVASEVGKGTRFTVELPTMSLSAAELDGFHEVPRAPHPTPWSEPPRPHGPDAGDVEIDLNRDEPVLLLAEDHAELRSWMSAHLASSFRVVAVADGRTALEEARRLVPDVIVSDIMMPGMDGDDLCKAVKMDPELSFVPVVLVTARGSREYRLSSLEGGADDYLVKPFDIEELLLRVRNMVDSRRRLRERYARRNLSLPVLAVKPASPDEGDAERLRARLERIVVDALSDEDFGVDALAKAMALSRATLYRRAEALLGESPMDLIWRMRLEQAALWLDETEATVAEIAYGVGFKSVPHFCKRFRDRFGMTPSEARGGASG